MYLWFRGSGGDERGIALRLVVACMRHRASGGRLLDGGVLVDDGLLVSEVSTLTRVRGNASSTEGKRGISSQQ